MTFVQLASLALALMLPVAVSARIFFGGRGGSLLGKWLLSSIGGPLLYSVLLAATFMFFKADIGIGFLALFIPLVSCTSATIFAVITFRRSQNSQQVSKLHAKNQ